MTTSPIARVPLLLALAALAAGCTPRARPLEGAPTVTRLPSTELPPGHRRVIFRWEYRDPSFGGRGEGVARIAPPDSVRLDFFLDGGVGGGGYAILIGDRVFSPAGAQAQRLLPPAPLLWASLGRLVVPPAADTVARVDGSLLRADIGQDPVWRATFADGRLSRLELIPGGRIREWVDRGDGSTVRYENERAQRFLQLTIQSTTAVPPFDEEIWVR